MIGYLGTQFLQSAQIGVVWAVVNCSAVAASIFIGCRYAEKVRGSSDSKLFSVWWALVGYGILWFWLLQPQTSNAIGLFLASIAMLGYVVMGLWLSSRFLVGLGILITVQAVVGYILLPGYFSLWMANTGGGGLIAGGVYALRNWR
jgi:hypothetical protein